ncbi:RINT1-like protein MAG2 [Impatiens glandulifera]|uniref:RINT1-like protein MAG2 n=1 Tax=Impatiens glandulifera TaxID=253017 RepID=UPI001FB0C882|nr:RINT1-like protein MAG2 [Impatiens glandulifera]
MDSVTITLPDACSLSTSALTFLDNNFNSADDLQVALSLESELQTKCQELDQSLLDLNRRLEASLLAYASYSDEIGARFTDINSKLGDLRSITRIPDCISGGKEEKGSGSSDHVWGEELPSLAKEVARVETVRTYAEMALKLDTLVGDIEDAVSSTVKRNLRKQPSQDSEDSRHVAIKALKLAEDILTTVTKTRPQWKHLVSAVDHRVDRSLAILRPQAIADHRSMLASLGWPPPFSDSNAEKKVQNPLFSMRGEIKHQYCESFIGLCSLQELQKRRKSRQLEGHFREVAIQQQQQPLWTIEELVNPISVAFQRHFSKWIDKPEFIFALLYKVTQDYVDSIEETLQPLVDEANLSGYSCREEWISAMISSLSMFLAKEIFPVHINELNGESSSSVTQSQARSSLLHLIDLMIALDKKMISLVAQSGISFDGNQQRISSLSVFQDRPDWLDLWAELELSDALDKLRLAIDDERNWSSKSQTGPQSYKSPAISGAFLKQLSYVVERCRSLPTIDLRSRFLLLTCVPIIKFVLERLILRCQDAEGLTALTEDDALIKVINSINCSRHFESVLKEWSEDIFFLEMELNHDDEKPQKGIFGKVIKKLEKFETEWVNKLSTVVLRGFEVQCRDYFKNKKHWLEIGEEGSSMVSRNLVGALDYLQGKMSVIEDGLNTVDFVGVWRSVAVGADSLIFIGMVMSNVKINDGGVERFGGDLAVLFGLFGGWCLRPEGFFPKLNDGMKVLKMEEKKLKQVVRDGERKLKENGIRHLSVNEVEKIGKSRVY